MDTAKRVLGWIATVLALLSIPMLSISRFTPYAFKYSIELQAVMGISLVGLVGGYLIKSKVLMTTYAIALTLAFGTMLLSSS